MPATNEGCGETAKNIYIYILLKDAGLPVSLIRSQVFCIAGDLQIPRYQTN